MPRACSSANPAARGRGSDSGLPADFEILARLQLCRDISCPGGRCSPDGSQIEDLFNIQLASGSHSNAIAGVTHRLHIKTHAHPVGAGLLHHRWGNQPTLRTICVLQGPVMPRSPAGPLDANLTSTLSSGHSGGRRRQSLRSSPGAYPRRHTAAGWAWRYQVYAKALHHRDLTGRAYQESRKADMAENPLTSGSRFLSSSGFQDSLVQPMTLFRPICRAPKLAAPSISALVTRVLLDRTGGCSGHFGHSRCSGSTELPWSQQGRSDRGEEHLGNHSKECP